MNKTRIMSGIASIAAGVSGLVCALAAAPAWATGLLALAAGMFGLAGALHR
ncbi:hypothetical protein GA0061078_0705 [Bifidobacterium bohemicum]|uniref:Uncharacterized protein n=1 Tax=Bifidobacterium bohemicum DSM 22767 TaxID=1437606 RepID=A0A086ZK98_9BIFI|nr:hypothetical protein [Bifidobacterium bohemicum]KFI46948.1 hypothetical protein BBOH_0422 [Bifidobacterium bohemicum DSM 22767]SCB85939.1 hypothetical protein GA0061078_0705 [Bifidobacterium bohemicum]